MTSDWKRTFYVSSNSALIPGTELITTIIKMIQHSLSENHILFGEYLSYFSRGAFRSQSNF